MRGTNRCTKQTGTHRPHNVGSCVQVQRAGHTTNIYHVLVVDLAGSTVDAVKVVMVVAVVTLALVALRTVKKQPLWAGVLGYAADWKVTVPAEVVFDVLLAEGNPVVGVVVALQNPVMLTPDSATPFDFAVTTTLHLLELRVGMLNVSVTGALTTVGVGGGGLGCNVGAMV